MRKACNKWVYVEKNQYAWFYSKHTRDLFKIISLQTNVDLDIKRKKNYPYL